MDKDFDHSIESLHLRPKTRQEIADEYGISVNTLKSKLFMAKITLPKGLIFPRTQKIIYYELGIPAGLKTA